MESIRFKIQERFLTLEDFMQWLRKAKGCIDIKVIKKILPQGCFLEEVCGTKCSYIFLRDETSSHLIGYCRYDQADDMYFIKKGGK